jgi:enamine deaminase RidA (YjgF/YER057c/UK114 family)
MIEEKLKQLGIRMPAPETTEFNYIPLTLHGNVVYLAGQIAKVDGRLHSVGKVGEDVGFEQARESARICILQGLSWIRHFLGDLDRIERILRLNAFLAVIPGYEKMSEIVDAASQLLIDIFGENGRHPRAVIGVQELPKNAPVLIELTVAVKASASRGTKQTKV